MYMNIHYVILLSFLVDIVSTLNSSLLNSDVSFDKVLEDIQVLTAVLDPDLS